MRAAQHLFGLNSIVFRPHNVYGEHQNIGDRYRNVIGIFMNQLMERIPLTIFGDGAQSRAFTYIGDIAPHIARSVSVPEAYNEIINIGADAVCIVNEVAGATMAAMGIDGTVRHLPARQEVRHAFADHAKAVRLFGIDRATPLAEGLHRMAEWARTAGIRRSRAFGAIEIARNLPDVWLDV